MLTIGQLATRAGVTTKAIRVYHARGLLPEPPRDASGYRRYDARAILDLTRIVTLAQAGVPLARIPRVLDSNHDAVEQLSQIRAELRRAIEVLEGRLSRLRSLEEPEHLCLPPEATRYMTRLRAIGLSERLWEAVRDGWVLGYALTPGLARTDLPRQAALLNDSPYVELLRGFDAAIDREPDDPVLETLADSAAEVAYRLQTAESLPSFGDAAPEMVDVLTRHQGVDTPAWRRLDQLVAERIKQLDTAAAHSTRRGAQADTPRK